MLQGPGQSESEEGAQLAGCPLLKGGGQGFRFQSPGAPSPGCVGWTLCAPEPGQGTTAPPAQAVPRASALMGQLQMRGPRTVAVTPQEPRMSPPHPSWCFCEPQGPEPCGQHPNLTCPLSNVTRVRILLSHQELRENSICLEFPHVSQSIKCMCSHKKLKLIKQCLNC